VLICLTSLTLLHAPAEASAAAPNDLSGDIRERLATAEAAFRVQNYPRVIETLRPLVGHRLLRARPEHRDLLEWIAVSYWLSGSLDAARLHFTKLIQEWPRHRLDELLYPPELITFFQVRRQDLIDLGVIDPARDPNVRTRLVLVRDEVRLDVPTIAYFAPFGVGQFINEEPGKATTVIVLQVLGLATSAATWLIIDSMKDDRGFISPGDASTASALNALWIAGAGIFGGSYVYSVVDGLVGQRRRPRIDYRYELLDVDELPSPPEVTELPAGPTVHVAPAGLGVGLHVGF